MNMKKLFVLAMFISLLALPFVFAQEKENREANGKDMEAKGEVGPYNDAEIASLGYGNGAEVRLLQLEKSIERNIVAGNAIISAIEESSNITVDTSNLTSIIAKLSDLKTKVSGIDTSSVNEETVKQFVELKAEAIDLTFQFKKAARSMVTEGQVDEIVKDVKDAINASSELQQLNSQIQTARHEYNALRLEHLFNITGYQNDTMLQKAKDGSLTLKEVKSVLMGYAKTLSKEQKKEAMAALKEDRAKNVVARQEIRDTVKGAVDAEKQERGWENKSLKDVKENAREKVKERMNAGEKEDNVPPVQEQEIDEEGEQE
jgi:hypothetical protein